MLANEQLVGKSVWWNQPSLRKRTVSRIDMTADELIPVKDCKHLEEDREHWDNGDPFCLLCGYEFTEDDYWDKFL